MEKNDTLVQLEQKTTNTYFPDGFNKEQNVRIDTLDWFIANFTGIKIELYAADGEPVTISTFLKSVSTSPVRIYLHTQLKVKVRYYNCYHIYKLMSAKQLGHTSGFEKKYS